MTKIPRTLSLLMAGTLSLPAVNAAVAESYPDMNMTYIVAAGVGGGTDVMTRTLVSVIEQKGLLPDGVRILVENRPGGSGAIGYTHIDSHKGDAYMLGGVGVSFFTTPLLREMPYNYESFTPLAAVARSPYIFVVRSQSPIESLDDIKTATGLKVGSVGAVADEALLTHLVNEKLGASVKVIPYDGGGEVIAAVLGGHLDVMWGNPNEMLEQVRSGAMRPLAVSAPERIPELPDVPTFEELGYDIDHTQLRGIIMPADVPPEAVSFWEGVMKTVAESDEWRAAYLDKFNEISLFMDSREFGAEMVETSARYEDLMRELGLIE
ncbi:Bug family tripartite tricarboxylate transporter substrate binding protein [Tropicimonas sp.]|uniref:Bug family tripartite tricarboxylate transporter substrate binding protein n=1 Tax=Tropicimonas sp. TaxID=2067044 RepID=UPI003A8A03AB